MSDRFKYRIIYWPMVEIGLLNRLPRALASLLLSVAAWGLLALVMQGTLALYGSIVALMLAFAGAFAGFVAYDAGAPVAQRRLARAGSISGCAALLIGSWLFLRAVTMF